MSTSPIQADLTLWSMLRTRRRRVEMLRGLDAMANRWVALARHARMGLGRLRREAEAVVQQQDQWANLQEAVLDQRIEELRAVFARRRQTLIHVRSAFAAVREVAYRTTGQRPYMVQIMGAMGLYHGQIVEMVTGEGKTLTASLAATVLAWLRYPVHVFTVNDYLAQRDADSRQPIFRRCGLRAGAIVGETPEPQRAAIYQLPIVYASAKEIMADWLRDQLRLGRIADPVSTRWLGQQGQKPMALVPGLFAAVVDEIDAILIDEAVTPLIIAQERGEKAFKDLYIRARELAGQLTLREHYTLQASDRRIELTNAGMRRLAELIQPQDHQVWHARRRSQELVTQALVAEHCYHPGEHYQVVDGKIVIVDEYTGRFMADRQWEHGLHQSVEAKHGLEVTADRDTLASISFQRFFRQYVRLSGMTGTAADAKPELERTYGLPVRVIPTNRPVRRIRQPDRIFARSEERWQAVAQQVEEIHRTGRPVLVGTRSIEASERVSALLKQRGLDHQVLNAVHHKAEAQIVAQAGEPGAITVATNMAGRGTDIQLGRGVAELGGLHVLLTERHTARRIDRQFIGRSGRQGDPGSACVMCSLEDDLMTKFAPGAAGWLRKIFASSPQSPAINTPPQALYAQLRIVFDWAQWRATHRAFRSRLMLIRHDYELDRSLPS